MWFHCHSNIQSIKINIINNQIQIINQLFQSKNPWSGGEGINTGQWQIQLTTTVPPNTDQKFESTLQKKTGGKFG